MDDIKEQVIRVLSEIIEDSSLSTAEIIHKILKDSPDINSKKFLDLSEYEMLDILIEIQADLST